MALVAYDNSDSSDYEDDENEKANIATIIKEPQASSKIEATSVDSTEAIESTPNLFNLLPQPSKKKPAVIEEDDEFLHKKERVQDVVKPKAKITVPSLSDFRDIESSTSIAKPKPAQGKKSGLLGMLPQPKNGIIATTTTKSFIPHVLSQANKDKNKVIQSSIKKPKVDTKRLINDSSDESDNEEVENDFFSINKPVEEPVDMPLPEEEVKDDISEPVSRLESYFKKDPVENGTETESIENYEQYETSGASYSNAQVEQSSNGDAVLDEEAILKLCGSRGKRKREDIQIVDINQQEVLDEAKEWLLKGLMDDTSKRMSSSKRRGNEPTSQQKRKHQITYLAHQAKANEAELQNQWANSRMSRRQTQNKYGF